MVETRAMRANNEIELNKINQPSGSGSNRGLGRGSQNEAPECPTRINWVFWGTVFTMPWHAMASCSKWTSSGTPRIKTVKFTLVMSVSMTSGAGGAAGVYEIGYLGTPEGAAKGAQAVNTIVSILDQIRINWTMVSNGGHRGHPDSHQLLCPPCPTHGPAMSPALPAPACLSKHKRSAPSVIAPELPRSGLPKARSMSADQLMELFRLAALKGKVQRITSTKSQPLLSALIPRPTPT